VFGVGKIEDIFVGHGITHAKHTASNQEGLEITLKAIAAGEDLGLDRWKTESDNPDDVRLIFTNLVDTDSLYGHRRDVEGYAGALAEIDSWLSRIIEALGPEDLLIISSDHGNDPTAPGTDHTREFVPLLAYSPALEIGLDASGIENHNLGTRQGFCDIAASLAKWLDAKWSGPGRSFIDIETAIEGSAVKSGPA
jgi:phosphopentomutase